jgi:deferrochelatase/peroxidase EfeB
MDKSFGFNDGISHPQVSGIDDQGLPPVDKVLQATKASAANNFLEPGIILVGRKGDRNADVVGLSRTELVEKPKWMKDGSFLVFRKLEQHVGAWNKFVRNNFQKAGLPTSTHLGAKLMGRWPSGT